MRTDAQSRMIDAVLTGTEACAYPTENGWTWASTPWTGWKFDIRLYARDPRYASVYAGDLRHDRCFFCGEKADPRKSEHYQDPQHGVPPTDAHQKCVNAHVRDLWHREKEKATAQMHFI